MSPKRRHTSNLRLEKPRGMKDRVGPRRLAVGTPITTGRIALNVSPGKELAARNISPSLTSGFSGLFKAASRAIVSTITKSSKKKKPVRKKEKEV